MLPETVEVRRHLDGVASVRTRNAPIYPHAVHIVAGSQPAKSLWTRKEEGAFPFSLLPPLARFLAFILKKLLSPRGQGPLFPDRGVSAFRRLAGEDLNGVEK